MCLEREHKTPLLLLLLLMMLNRYRSLLRANHSRATADLLHTAGCRKCCTLQPTTLLAIHKSKQSSCLLFVHRADLANVLRRQN